MRCGNVVGYQNIESDASSYSGGPTFGTVSGTKGEFKLGDFKALNMSPYDDFIQFLDSSDASTYLSVVYLDAETYGDELAGWWDPTDIGGTSYNEESFVNGTAFLVANYSGNTIVFQYAGEVLSGFDCTVVIPEGTGSPFICNPTPVDLKLGQVVALGMSPYDDFFQFLDPDDASTYLSVVCLDEETYGEELAGWWDPTDIGGVSYNEESLPSGGALLGAIYSGNEIVVQFPDPLASKAE